MLDLNKIMSNLKYVSDKTAHVDLPNQQTLVKAIISMAKAVG